MSFPISIEGGIEGLAWDGEALRLSVGDQVIRITPDGEVLGSVSVPLLTSGLAWDPSTATFWTYYLGEFLFEFSADGTLLQTYYVPVYGGEGRPTWTSDGLWVVDFQSFWQCVSSTGEILGSSDLTDLGLPQGGAALGWDERGYLWLAMRDNGRIYQISLRREEVQAQLMPIGWEGGELALPHPQIKPASIADKAMVHFTNNLQGTMTLAFGSWSAIVQPGDTWSAELEPDLYTVYASANVPEPIAFSAEEVLVPGYEYTWVMIRPE